MSVQASGRVKDPWRWILHSWCVPFHNRNLLGGEVVEGEDVAVEGGFEGGDVGGGVGLGITSYLGFAFDDAHKIEGLKFFERLLKRMLGVQKYFIRGGNSLHALGFGN